MNFKFFTLLLLLSPLFLIAQNVGIGTSTPSAKLEIVSTNSGVLVPRLALTGTSDATTVPAATVSELIYNTATAGSGSTAVRSGYYYWDGSKWVPIIADEDWMKTDGSYPDAVTNNIYTTGNVGIGTASPTHQLDIRDQSYFEVNLTNATYAKIGNLVSSNDALRIASYGNVEVNIDDNGNSTGKYFRVMNSETELARINDVGDMGIGTTSPYADLDIVNSAPSLGHAFIRIAHNNLAPGSAASYFVLEEQDMPTDVDNSTSTTKMAPTFRLRSESTRADHIGFITEMNQGLDSYTHAGGISPAAFRFIVREFPTAGSTSYSGLENRNIFQVLDHTTEYFLIQADGDVFINGGVAVTSDKKYKTNIEPLHGSLEKINKVTGYSYNWNQKANKDTQARQIGFIAQDLETQYPELVEEIQLTNGETTKAVNYQQMTAVLLEGIKELNQKIESLEKEIESLKKKG